MTDPEATLRETLSDEVLLKASEAFDGNFYTSLRPVVEETGTEANDRVARAYNAMRDVLITAVAPLLTPRAWQEFVQAVDDYEKTLPNGSPHLRQALERIGVAESPRVGRQPLPKRYGESFL